MSQGSGPVPCRFPTSVCPRPLGDGFEAGSVTSIFSNRAVVRCSRLEDVLHGCSWKINNKLDGTYTPLPLDKVVQRAKHMINKVVQYSLIEGNCEHFVNDLRYGVSRSQQVGRAPLALRTASRRAVLRSSPQGTETTSGLMPCCTRGAFYFSRTLRFIFISLNPWRGRKVTGDQRWGPAWPATLPVSLVRSFYF